MFISQQPNRFIGQTKLSKFVALRLKAILLDVENARLSILEELLQDGNKVQVKQVAHSLSIWIGVYK